MAAISATLAEHLSLLDGEAPEKTALRYLFPLAKFFASLKPVLRTPRFGVDALSGS